MQQYQRSRSALSVHVQAGLSELHLLVNSGKKQLLLHSASLLCLSRFTSQADFDVDCDATRLAAPSTVVKKTADEVNWTMMTDRVKVNESEGGKRAMKRVTD